MATQTRPDLSFRVNQAAQYTTIGTIRHGLLLNRVVKDAEILRCIVFWRGKSLEQSSILVFGDAAFGNATRGRSQFGIIVVLTFDVQKYMHSDYSTGFVVYWCSSVIKRVVRSTLAAEAYAVSEAAENGLMITQILEELLFGHRRRSLTAVDQQPKLPLIICTDSRNLEQTVKADTTAVADKRLRIVVCMLRQFFEEDELEYLQWIPTNLMLADQLTKVVPGTKRLQIAMEAGESEQQGIEHDVHMVDTEPDDDG